MKITLTFDNGPHPDVTPEVLAVLHRRNLAATFFVVGKNLADPAAHRAMRQAHDAGHWIGNHTFSHAEPLGRLEGTGAAVEEIRRTEALIGDLAHPDRLFRPPGGGGVLSDNLLDRPALTHLQREAYTVVLWNAVPGDWKLPDGWVDVALDQCRALDWALLVLHDLPTGAMAHLDRFLGRVVEEGGTFVQDFPPDTVPIRRGQIVGEIAPYVKAAA